MLMAQETSTNISLEANDFAQSCSNLSVMECMSKFKNHLEDLVETTENLREKIAVLKDRESSVAILRQELHQEKIVNQNLLQEVEQLGANLKELESA